MKAYGHLIQSRRKASKPKARKDQHENAASCICRFHSLISGRGNTGMSHPNPTGCLTTRWSAPGHGGAIIRTGLGRAAHLEAVGQPLAVQLWTRDRAQGRN